MHKTQGASPQRCKKKRLNWLGFLRFVLDLAVDSYVCNDILRILQSLGKRKDRQGLSDLKQYRPLYWGKICRGREVSIGTRGHHLLTSWVEGGADEGGLGFHLATTRGKL